MSATDEEKYLLHQDDFWSKQGKNNLKPNASVMYMKLLFWFLKNRWPETAKIDNSVITRTFKISDKKFVEARFALIDKKFIRFNELTGEYRIEPIF